MGDQPHFEHPSGPPVQVGSEHHFALHPYCVQTVTAGTEAYELSQNPVAKHGLLRASFAIGIVGRNQTAATLSEIQDFRAPVALIAFQLRRFQTAASPLEDQYPGV